MRGRSLCHSHESAVRGSPPDQGLRRVRRASPRSACHPSRWAVAGQREQVSPAERSDAVAACHPLSRRERTEAREDRETAGEGKRKGGGESVAWMRVLRPPEARKADLPNVVMLKQEIQAATCQPRGSCIQWPPRCPDPLPRRGQLPHDGRH